MPGQWEVLLRHERDLKPERGHRKLLRDQDVGRLERKKNVYDGTSRCCYNKPFFSLALKNLF
jgi:hypothetical protein